MVFGTFKDVFRLEENPTTEGGWAEGVKKEVQEERVNSGGSILVKQPNS